jgi:signal transduction histidine kinase
VKSIESDIAAIGRIGAVPSILRVVSETTGLRLVLIARVTEDSWTACATLDRMDFGLRVGDELNVAHTLCREVRGSLAPIVIEHASREPDYCDHPVPRMYGFESYVAIPIFRPDGEYFGNLCALDAHPAELRNPRTMEMLRLFADMVSLQLSAEEEHQRARDALSEERRTAELRDQFIAVLGHDLRSPLASVVTGAGFLLELDPGETERTILERIHSSGERMARLIDDVLDFARGRMGGGIPVAAEEVDDVPALVDAVVAEVAGANPGREVRTECRDPGRALVDRARVAQLFSNLVANAVEHGPPEEPVEVRVDGTDALVRFAVTNRGEPIPPELMPRLFHPFVRGSGSRPRSGLGLGLYIASEIARAHGGSLHVSSTAETGTTFTAVLPRSGPA